MSRRVPGADDRVCTLAFARRGRPSTSVIFTRQHADVSEITPLLISQARGIRLFWSDGLAVAMLVISLCCF